MKYLQEAYTWKVLKVDRHFSKKFENAENKNIKSMKYKKYKKKSSTWKVEVIEGIQFKGFCSLVEFLASI